MTPDGTNSFFQPFDKLEHLFPERYLSTALCPLVPGDNDVAVDHLRLVERHHARLEHVVKGWVREALFHESVNDFSLELNGIYHWLQIRDNVLKLGLAGSDAEFCHVKALKGRDQDEVQELSGLAHLFRIIQRLLDVFFVLDVLNDFLGPLFLQIALLQCVVVVHEPFHVRLEVLFVKVISSEDREEIVLIDKVEGLLLSDFVLDFVQASADGNGAFWLKRCLEEEERLFLGTVVGFVMDEERNDFNKALLLLFWKILQSAEETEEYLVRNVSHNRETLQELGERSRELRKLFLVAREHGIISGFCLWTDENTRAPANDTLVKLEIVALQVAVEVADLQIIEHVLEGRPRLENVDVKRLADQVDEFLAAERGLNLPLPLSSWWHKLNDVGNSKMIILR